jgi:hypothetical protein
MANYFFNPGQFPEIPKRDDPAVVHKNDPQAGIRP